MVVSTRSSLRTIAEVMIQKKVETVFVVENEKVLGVLGIRDLFTLPIPASFGGPMQRQVEESLINRWTEPPVENLMNQDVIRKPEDYPLMLAAEMMVNRGKHPLAVMQGEKMVGTIDRRDIVQALLMLNTQK